jgi:hypothetical protein
MEAELVTAAPVKGGGLVVVGPKGVTVGTDPPVPTIDTVTLDGGLDALVLEAAEEGALDGVVDVDVTVVVDVGAALVVVVTDPEADVVEAVELDDTEVVVVVLLETDEVEDEDDEDDEVDDETAVQSGRVKVPLKLPDPP